MQIRMLEKIGITSFSKIHCHHMVTGNNASHLKKILELQHFRCTMSVTYSMQLQQWKMSAKLLKTYSYGGGWKHNA